MATVATHKKILLTLCNRTLDNYIKLHYITSGLNCFLATSCNLCVSQFTCNWTVSRFQCRNWKLFTSIFNSYYHFQTYDRRWTVYASETLTPASNDMLLQTRTQQYESLPLWKHNCLYLLLISDLCELSGLCQLLNFYSIYFFIHSCRKLQLNMSNNNITSKHNSTSPQWFITII
jgi:hypothetical protein